MIAWVVEAALTASAIEEVWVATDAEAIAHEAEAAGARTILVTSECASGTDRVAAAARSVAADVYVNLQGDEPLVEPEDIDALASVFRREAGTRMATLARPLDRPEDLASPDVVKVVCDADGFALYFSRSPIPYCRDRGAGAASGKAPVPPLRHLGAYAFRAEALRAFAELPPGDLEQTECLEQLRALEAGWRIRVLPARGESLGVDRPEDLLRAEKAMRARFDPGRLGC